MIGSSTFILITFGSTKSIGLPLTLKVPLPLLQWATAIAFFFLPNVYTNSTVSFAILLSFIYLWFNQKIV